MADCLNNEEAINSQLSSTNTDAVSSNLDVDNGVSSELVGSNDMTSNIQGEETTTALLNEEEPLDSVLDQSTTAKYNGGETDNIVVSVDNSTHTITATLKPIKFKTVANFPVVGSDRLLYIDATENSIYSWDSDIGEYRKLVADTGEVDIDLSNYYTKEETDGVASQTLGSAKSYTDTKVAELIDSAPETLDTFKEIADAFKEDQEVLDALNSAIGNKVDKVEGKGLSTNDYTTEEKTKLAGIEEGANKTVVDTEFSTISTNPIANSTVTERLRDAVWKTTDQTINSVKTFEKQPKIADSVTESMAGRYIVSAEAIQKFLRDNYQEILVEGNNITIEGNTISANLEGSSPIVTLTSPVVIYDLPSGMYQLPAGCDLYINSSYVETDTKVTYDNKSVALMVVNTIKTTSGTDDKLFYLFAEQDGVTADTVGNSGSFIVGKAKQDTGNYHIVGTDIKYVTQETDGYINGNKSFVNPVKYYNQYESLATSLNDRTLVDAQWVNAVLSSKGYLTGIPSEYVTETELTAKNYATKSEIPNTNNFATKSDLANYFPLAGGAIGANGISWSLESLPQDTAPMYVCTIDGFAIGGRQKWASIGDLKTQLGVPDTSSFVTTDTTQTITGKKTFSGNGLAVSGRAVGSGDDEGIVVSPASNNYAGICLGNPSGKRTVLYLHSNGNSVWRYNNGSSSYDLTHPAKGGTVAITADIPHLYQHTIYLVGTDIRIGLQIFNTVSSKYTTAAQICSWVYSSECRATSNASGNWYPAMGGSKAQSLSVQGISCPSGNTTAYISYVRDGYTFGTTSGDISGYTLTDNVKTIF